MLGRIHSIETFGSVDGPGVRFVIFVQGCRLRCAYCHNADTWDVNRGEFRSVSSLLDQAERYRAYWGEEGGITVSGGEPLLQTDFLTELFAEAKRRNISTCIDTALEPYEDKEEYREKFDALMEVTDLLLIDIKHIDREKHKLLTGKGNTNILQGIRHIDALGKPFWIRQVLVEGYTDNEEDLKETRAFIDSLKHVQRVEVLPYHTLGKYKWDALGIPYRLEGAEAPSQMHIARAERILKEEKA